MEKSELTPFERISLQMEAIVPVIRKLEARLGKEAVQTALRDSVTDEIEQAANEQGGEGNLAKTAAAFNSFAKGDALHFELIASEKGTLNVDVHHCRYAQMMADLDAADLGPMLICDQDYIHSLRSGVELTRTQTRMLGASHCDFRFKRRQA